MYAVFVNNVLGSESCLASTNIFGLRVSQGTSETFLCFRSVNVEKPSFRQMYQCCKFKL